MTEARNQRHVPLTSLGIGTDGRFPNPARRPYSVTVENAGSRRKDKRQTLDDRLREIKRCEGWVDAADLGGVA